MFDEIESDVVVIKNTATTNIENVNAAVGFSCNVWKCCRILADFYHCVFYEILTPWWILHTICIFSPLFILIIHLNEAVLCLQRGCINEHMEQRMGISHVIYVWCFII